MKEQGRRWLETFLPAAVQFIFHGLDFFVLYCAKLLYSDQCTPDCQTLYIFCDLKYLWFCILRFASKGRSSSAKIVKKNLSNHVYRVFKHEMLYWNQISSLNDFFLFEKSRSAIICQKCHRLLQLLLQFLNNSLLPGHKWCDLYNRLELD